MGGRKKLEGPGVDYYQLPRKQLQSLCKRYGFPANKTNILMAEFLTSHLNSDEYLNRDKSLPSPAVKTKFQCRDQESTTDEDLPTISELQPTASETLARNLSLDFIINDDERTGDQAPEASKAEEKSHVPLEICVGPEVGSPLEEDRDLTNASSRIRDSCLLFKNVSRPCTPVRSTSEESMECTVKGSEVEGCVVEARHLSTSEEVTNVTTTVHFGKNEFSVESQKAPGEETPLPLSVMPHVRSVTPDSYAYSAEKGVKLFADLETDSGLLPSENLRDYYRAWGAPLRTRTDQDKTHEDVISGVLRTFEGSESNGSLVLEGQLDTGLYRTDRADKEEDGIESLLLQASTASINFLKTDTSVMKSCLTPSRKLSSTLNVSFLCPQVVSSPRSITELAGRSEIVKEWTDVQIQEKSFDQTIETSCASKEQAENDELVLKTLDQDSLALESSEVNERFPCDLESPPEGIVEKAVSIYEQHKLSTRVPSLMQRKDSYKSSPFLKTSRIAAELERASTMGQTRRVGILAMKRAMGIAPLFSDSAKEVVEESATDDATSSPLSGSSAIEGDDAGNANTRTSQLLASADPMGVQNDQVSETEVSPSDVEVEATPKNLFSTTDISLIVASDFTEDEATILSPEEVIVACAYPMGVQNDQVQETEVSPSDVEVEATPENLPSRTEISLVVTSGSTEDEKTILPPEEGIVDMDEQTIVARIDAATGPIVEESETPLDADEAMNLQARVDEVISNLSWMTKPTQLPRRRPLNQKLKEKPGRPFSTNGRTLELMERASAKLKMLKKSTAVREEGVVSKPRRSTSVSIDESQIQVCALQVEPPSEVTIAPTEIPVAGSENGLNTSSQLGVSEELVVQNGKMRFAVEEERNVRGPSEAIESLSLERHSVCEDFWSEEEKKASEQSTVALSFLEIDFRQTRVGKQNDVLQFPGSVSETDSAKFTTEKITAAKFMPLCPLDSNRLPISTDVPSFPNETTPTKPSGILLDVLSGSVEKNNSNGLVHGKENERCKRQEQHKTPLTGKSKEKALRTAEIKAASFREQLLRKRRGMLEEEKIDGADYSAQSVQLSPLTQVPPIRLL